MVGRGQVETHSAGLEGQQQHLRRAGAGRLEGPDNFGPGEEEAGDERQMFL